jgi:hypothetical protein
VEFEDRRCLWLCEGRLRLQPHQPLRPTILCVAQVRARHMFPPCIHPWTRSGCHWLTVEVDLVAGSYLFGISDCSAHVENNHDVLYILKPSDQISEKKRNVACSLSKYAAHARRSIFFLDKNTSQPQASPGTRGEIHKTNYG